MHLLWLGHFSWVVGDLLEMTCLFLRQRKITDINLHKTTDNEHQNALSSRE